MLTAGAMLVACAIGSGDVRAESTRGDEAVNFVEITLRTRASIDLGLAFLAAQQQKDGSFGSDRYGRHVGITALACLAFMADGHTPGRGQYGRAVQRGLGFILDHSTESGLIAADTSHGPMYGHGFATLMLGEIYGMSNDRRVREALLKAVRLIVQTQNHEGGWRYHPVPHDADISVTICQVMALRAARNAGIAVPTETIDRAIAYVRGCQNPGDGGFRYMLSAGGSQFPRSAAGVAALFYAGVYEGRDIEMGLGYLMGHLPGRPGQRREGHYFYGQYYAAQAMFLAGGKWWQLWYPSIREQLLDRQRDDGGWDANHGEAYGTAMSLLVLQIPNRLLPIFQR